MLISAQSLYPRYLWRRWVQTLRPQSAKDGSKLQAYVAFIHLDPGTAHDDCTSRCAALGVAVVEAKDYSARLVTNNDLSKARSGRAAEALYLEFAGDDLDNHIDMGGVWLNVFNLHE